MSERQIGLDAEQRQAGQRGEGKFSLTLHCPKCRTLIGPGMSFCTGCGVALPYGARQETDDAPSAERNEGKGPSSA